MQATILEVLAMVMATMQVLIGGAITMGAMLSLYFAIDHHKHPTAFLFFVFMAAMGAWYMLDPLILGVPTSTKPGLLFSGLIAWALLKHGRQVRGIVERDALWRSPRNHATAGFKDPQ